jgi:hypothetical protein
VAVRELPVEEMAYTVEDYYRQSVQDETAALADLLPDAELEDIFERATDQGLRPAAKFLAEHRKVIVDKIAYWTGVRRPLVKKLIEVIGQRAQQLELCVPQEKETKALVDVTAFAATLAMNYLTRGRFAEK